MLFEDLKDKVVVVTGAGSGIGQAVAVGFASQGSKVIVTDISKENIEQTCRLIQGNSGHCTGMICDVRNEASVRNMVEEIINHYQGIDVLVNNAGIVCEKKLMVDIDEESWDQIFSVNLKGTFLCSKHIGKVFMSNRKGTIINIGSISAKIPRWQMASYSASKAAVVQLSRVMAIEMAEYGIRVNAICPGGTNTPLMETSISRDGESSAEYRILGSRQFFRAGIPLRRLAEPENHVGAALFLASDLAACHITGQELYIDGGESVI